MIEAQRLLQRRERRVQMEAQDGTGLAALLIRTHIGTSAPEKAAPNCGAVGQLSPAQNPI